MATKPTRLLSAGEREQREEESIQGVPLASPRPRHWTVGTYMSDIRAEEEGFGLGLRPCGKWHGLFLIWTSRTSSKPMLFFS